jgi:DNA-binding NtrC family response regulator
MTRTSDARVLVVDHHPAMSELISVVLSRSGIAADQASTRDTALRLAASHRYSAVIVEPRMLDGDALLSELYASAPDGRPNIIITTLPGQPTAPWSLRAGVVAVLLKPFRLEELFDAVARCCAADEADSRGGEYVPRLSVSMKG